MHNRKRSWRLYIVFFSCLFTCFAAAAQENIIPQPVTVSYPAAGGSKMITGQSRVWTNDPRLKSSAAFLTSYLQQYYKLKVGMSTSKTSADIQLAIDTHLPDTTGWYRLSVDATGIHISSRNPQGVFYGVQTFLQLLPTGNNPAANVAYINVIDYPRFQYRGMHLDVCRHFFPVSFIKKYIDYLALHKINTFHWHLTDDQGWRIEIKKYPALTETGSKRNGTIIGRYPGKGSDNTPYGGFYTQREIKEIIRYANERFITIIPEIEMPGHASAAIAAYPWLSCFPGQPTDIPAAMISNLSKEQQANGRIKLVQETWGVFDDVFCAGNDSTFLFLENVLDEVVRLFPSKYIHIGGDECPKTHWKTCPRCQQRMKELGLKDEHELQSYFIRRIEDYLTKKGRSIIGWDEILEGGLAPNATVMSWRGEAGGIAAAQQQHKVIMTPGNPVYFDHTQSRREDSVTIGGYNPIENVYAYDPVPKELDAQAADFILGAQANLWTEYIGNPKKVEYMLFPRLSALSEVQWTSPANKSWSSFEQRLPSQLARYSLWGANYSKAYFDLQAMVIPDSAGMRQAVRWKLSAKAGRIVYNKTLTVDDPPNPAPFSPYIQPVLITKSGTYDAWTILDNGSYGNPVKQQFFFNKATGKTITLSAAPSSKYPGSGAFTLVDGVQNTSGLGRSFEFIGFEGTDCTATIDLGEPASWKELIVHTLEQPGSWIYAPSALDISISADGIDYAPPGVAVQVSRSADHSRLTLSADEPITARFIKITIRNHGIIATGNPGAGNRAWLFLDEIELN